MEKLFSFPGLITLGAYHDVPRHPRPLPPEILEKILSFADGETLLACKLVSPMFRDVVSRLTTATDIWKRCFVRELAPTRASLYRFLAKLYPHDNDDDYESTVDWEYAYTRCLLTQLTTFPSECSMSATKVGNPHIKTVHDILVHGDMILVHVQYNKNFAMYSKVKTIDQTGEVVDSSCRFDRTAALYVTPVDNDNVPKGAVLLHCDVCNLVGKPLHLGLVQNGEVIQFEKSDGLVSKSNLRVQNCVECTTQIDKPFLLHTPSLLHSSEFSSGIDAWTELRSEVTCTKVWGHLIFMGTVTGKLYGYTWKGGDDIRNFSLRNYIWSYNVSERHIVSIDFMITRSQFRLICCDVLNVFSILLNDWTGNPLTCNS